MRPTGSGPRSDIVPRAGETGALARLSAALENGAALARRFAAARRESAPVAPSFGLYLGLLTYGLAATEKARLAAFLHLDKRREQLLGDMTALSDKLPALSRPGLSPYQVYRECRGLSPEAIQAFGIAAENETVSAYLRLYLDKLRYVTTRLNGDDLKNMGLAAGPRMKEVLERLLQARLDGEIIQRQEEETLARRLVAEENA